jgi:nicotinamidase-related amidase
MSSNEAPLLIVDVQQGFVNERSRHIIPRVAGLAITWLKHGSPVYMSQFVNSPDSPWERWIHWSSLQSDDEIAIYPPLDTLADQATVYQKQTYSSIVGPFAEGLAESQWPEVIVCGIATDSCVLATALDLFDHGVRPLVVSDACASHAGKAVHDAGLLVISRNIGIDQVLKSEELIGRVA